MTTWKSGYPDITANDGIYSSYIPRYAATPGYYGLCLTVTDNHGAAVVPKHQSSGKNIKDDLVQCCNGQW